MRLAPLGKEISSELLESMSEAEIAELLRKLTLIKSNIRHASSKRGAVNGSRLRQGYP